VRACVRACVCVCVCVCVAAAIHNLHATSLNGAVMFILRKDERVLLPRGRKAAVRTISLVYILYYTLFTLPFRNDGYMYAACSREERSRQRFHQSTRFTALHSQNVERGTGIYRDVSGYRLFPKHMYVRATCIRVHIRRARNANPFKAEHTLALVAIYAYRQCVACI